MSFAEKVSRNFEAEILSHGDKTLSELMQCFVASKQCESKMSESVLDTLQALHQCAMGKNVQYFPSTCLIGIFMSRIFDTRIELTCGEIGRAAMIWLGSGKPRQDFYEKFVKNNCDNSSWKSFIELAMVMESLRGAAPSEKLLIAMEETYLAKWRTFDYMSPNCFLYLIERLWFLVLLEVSFTLQKSSFMEWLIRQQPYTNLIASLVPEESARRIFDFVADVIQKFVHNIQDTVEWMKRWHKVHPSADAETVNNTIFVVSQLRTAFC